MDESILTRAAPAADLRLAYGPHPFQFGDLRLPAGGGPHPCLMVIHGGFWRARYDLEHVGHLCHALTAAGLATWNIEYRRVGNLGGGWPGTFLDVARAAQWLFAVGLEHRLDAARISVLGHSAGGHLALWLAGLGRVPAGSEIGAGPLPFRAAVSLAGVVDLRRAWALGLSDRAVEGLLGGSPTAVPDRYAAASPHELLPLGVRQLLVHGREDGEVPHALSEAYQAAAAARGEEATLLSLTDTGHFDLIDPASPAWRAILGELMPVVSG